MGRGCWRNWWSKIEHDRPSDIAASGWIANDVLQDATGLVGRVGRILIGDECDLTRNQMCIKKNVPESSQPISSSPPLTLRLEDERSNQPSDKSNEQPVETGSTQPGFV